MTVTRGKRQIVSYDVAEIINAVDDSDDEQSKYRKRSGRGYQKGGQTYPTLSRVSTMEREGGELKEDVLPG